MHGCGVLKPNYFKKHHFHLLAVNIPDNFGHGVLCRLVPCIEEMVLACGQMKNVASWNNLALALHGKIIVNSCMLKCSTAGIFHFSDLFQSKFFLKAYSKWKIWMWSSYSKWENNLDETKRMNKIWSTINLRVSVNFILQGWKLLK